MSVPTFRANDLEGRPFSSDDLLAAAPLLLVLLRGLG